MLERVVGPVSRETIDQLQVFVEHLLKWNQSINLVSMSSVESVWTRHVIDSAQLSPLIGKAKKIIDLGSGGGFPGVVISILDRSTKVHLVESNRKKAAFLQYITGSLGLACQIHAQRSEQINHSDPFDVVTSRAVGSLQLLLELSERWLERGTRALFLKGRDYRSELEQIADAWRFDLIEHRSLTESQSAVLEFSNVSRRVNP